MAGAPLDLTRAVTFSLNDIVGLWVGGSLAASDGGGSLTRFSVLRDGSATSQIAVSPFTFVGMVDRHSTTSSLGWVWRRGDGDELTMPLAMSGVCARGGPRAGVSSSASP